jgi:hypothetical protein
LASSRAGAYSDSECEARRATPRHKNAMAIAHDEREALRMLAGTPNGSTESILLTHGFAIGMLHDLVRNGLATAETRTMRAGGGSFESGG